MAKIKLTKNELKRQKDALKRFQRYLPTLQLKKQQLQMEIRRIEAEKRAVQAQLEEFNQQIKDWVALFSEKFDFTAYLKVNKVKTSVSNIAGIDIPLFEGIDFEIEDYDLFFTPYWVDSGFEAIKSILELRYRSQTLQKQVDLLSEELRTTTQRVNLFEKVKIPEAKGHIRKINVYLGDQQTAAVVRGKMSKKKLERMG